VKRARYAVIPTLGALVLGGLVAGCHRTEESAEAPAPSASSIVMTGPLTGHAVLPSGARWVVIGTTDGWRTVSNETPTAVPTDGGLALDALGRAVVLGILPHEMLTVSPVFASADSARSWAAGQLPGGLVDGSHAVSLWAGGMRALVTNGGGELVASVRARGPWRVVTSAAALASPKPHLLAVTSFPRDVVVLTGSGTSTEPLLYASADAGATWQSESLPVGGSAGSSATALAPCRVGGTWLVPVVSGASLQLDRAADWSGPWAASTSVPVGSNSVVACSDTGVWVFGGEHNEDLQVADATGTWTSEGSVSEPVTGASVVSSDTAFVTVAGASQIVQLVIGESLTQTALPLPGWVASVGGPPMRS
jgi:hypothetical protein